jgi:5'-3' exonuclease
MELLIDGDVIVYRIGFATQHKDEGGEVVADPLAYALHSCKVYINGMVKKTGADKSRLFLTGGGNFRSVVDTEYKANRKGTAKPVHYQAIRDYMVNKLGAEMIEGMEADDKLALCQTNDTMIATIDKDLLMVAGKHYNFVKDEYKDVTQEEGTRWFYTQMLTGDKVDNIIGLKGIGPIKAEKILSESEDWLLTLESKYKDFFGEATKKGEVGWYQRLVQNQELLWMLQTNIQSPIDFKGDETLCTSLEASSRSV